MPAPGRGARAALGALAAGLVALGARGPAEWGLAAVLLGGAVAGLRFGVRVGADEAAGEVGGGAGGAGAGPPGTAAPYRPGLVEGAAVVLATVWLGVRAAALPLRDQPVGTDALRYLKNALALAGDGQGYQNWRAPLQGWLSLALTPVAGWLLEASQLLSWLAVTSLPALTAALGWVLGGRRARGAAVGVGGAVLLAAWPDLQLFARSSTPYPLLAALLAGGTLALAGALVPGSGAAPPPAPTPPAPASAATAGPPSPTSPLRPLLLGALGGVLLGLARATDLRGGPWAAALLLALLLGAALDAPAGGRAAALRRASPAVLLAALLAAALSAGLLSLLPVELLPLSRQVGLQSDLNASSANPLCRVGGGELPPLPQILGACGWSTLLGNLGRAAAAAPLGLGALGLLGLLGLGAGGWTRRLVLLAPAALAAPSLLVVAAQHRYVLPLAPAAALLLAEALVGLLAAPLPRLDAAPPPPVAAPTRDGGVALRFGAASRPAFPLTLPLLGGLALAAVLATNPETLLARAASGRSAGGGTVAVLGAPRGLTLVRTELRRGLRPGELVYDCARGDLDLRVWPHPVVEPERTGCKALLRSGPAPGQAAWLLAGARPDEPVSAAWTKRVGFPRGPEQVGLWYAGPQGGAGADAAAPPSGGAGR